MNEADVKRKETPQTMNGTYAEAGVKRKETPQTILVRFGLVFLVVILFLISGLFPFMFVFAAVSVVGTIYLFPRLSMEYEYVFCDGQLDFDRISGNAKRKTMLKVDFDLVEVAAPEGSHALDAYKGQKLRLRDFTSKDKECKPFVIICRVENELTRVHFEPNEKMITCMRNKAPRKVLTY